MSKNYFVEQRNSELIIQTLGDATISHPFDTHPPTIARVVKLGLHSNDVNYNDLAPTPPAADEIFTDLNALEEDLTTLEHQWLIGTGRVVLSDAPPTDASTEEKQMKCS